MAKHKSNFERGSATVTEFFNWINERHAIYIRRKAGLPRSEWTQDPIMRDRKFTNVFRQLDRGTVWLTDNFIRRWQEECEGGDLDVLLFNIVLYRSINYYPTFEELGWIHDWSCEDHRKVLLDRDNRRDKVFTSAHMTAGRGGERKVVSMIRMADRLWNEREDLLEYVLGQTLEQAFDNLLAFKFFGVGKFIAYEIVSDLRWTPILEHAPDKLTWANIGPGCRRGLARLGLPIELESLRYLYRLAHESTDEDMVGDSKVNLGSAGLKPHVIKHHVEWARWNEVEPELPYFELREIEHCLCEFDKYCRGGGKERFVPHES